MKDTYTYQIGENLYLNLTNRCPNRCVFCVRNGKETYEGMLTKQSWILPAVAGKTA